MIWKMKKINKTKRERRRRPNRTTRRYRTNSLMKTILKRARPTHSMMMSRYRRKKLIQWRHKWQSSRFWFKRSCARRRLMILIQPSARCCRRSPLWRGRIRRTCSWWISIDSSQLFYRLLKLRNGCQRHKEALVLLESSQWLQESSVVKEICHSSHWALCHSLCSPEKASTPSLTKLNFQNRPTSSFKQDRGSPRSKALDTKWKSRPWRRSTSTTQ